MIKLSKTIRVSMSYQLHFIKFKLFYITRDSLILHFAFFPGRFEIFTSSHHKVSQNHMLYMVYIIYHFLYYFCDLIFGSQYHLRMTIVRNISYSPSRLPSIYTNRERQVRKVPNTNVSTKSQSIQNKLPRVVHCLYCKCDDMETKCTLLFKCSKLF